MFGWWRYDITFGDRSGILSLQSISETHFRSCMLRSGKSYQPVSEMSEVTDLLKAWMEETRKQELGHEEERRRYEQERAEEKRRYEQERAEEITIRGTCKRANHGKATSRCSRAGVTEAYKARRNRRYRSLFDELRESSRSSWGGAR